MRNGYGGCYSYGSGTTTFNVSAGQVWVFMHQDLMVMEQGF